MNSLHREDYTMVDGGGYTDMKGQKLCLPAFDSAHVSVASWWLPDILLKVNQGRSYLSASHSHPVYNQTVSKSSPRTPGRWLSRACGVEMASQGLPSRSSGPIRTPFNQQHSFALHTLRSLLVPTLGSRQGADKGLILRDPLSLPSL